MFIFKYKEIFLYDNYAPFTPPVTQIKQRSCSCLCSWSWISLQGFFQYGNSAPSAAIPRSTFSMTIHSARQIWALALLFIVRGTSWAIWKAQMIVNHSAGEFSHYSIFQYPITSTKELGKPWRCLFIYCVFRLTRELEHCGSSRGSSQNRPPGNQLGKCKSLGSGNCEL